MNSAKIANLLLPGERRILEKLGISLQPTSLTFLRKVTQGQMRSIWSLLMTLRGRAIGAKTDSINWALGDCLLTAERWFGKKFVQDLTEEERKLRMFRDHVLMLAGATLIQIQHLEYLVNACCAFLSLQVKGKKIKVKLSDLMSTNKKHRTKTLGPLKDALIETGAFDSRFEARFNRFVDNRNHFVHHFWFDTSQRWKGRPSWTQLRKTERFVASILREATRLLPTFQGLFYIIGNGVGNSEGSPLPNDFLNDWAEYERDLLSVIRV